MTFESEGYLIVAFYIWLSPASYVVFLLHSDFQILYFKMIYNSILPRLEKIGSVFITKFIYATMA